MLNGLLLAGQYKGWHCVVWTALTTRMVSVIWFVIAANQYLYADGKSRLRHSGLSNIGLNHFGYDLSSHCIYFTHEQLASYAK